MAPLSKQGSKTDRTKSPAAEKTVHPAREFSEPSEVVTDLSLSAQEKRLALSSLEQDARQLAVATAEGMTGGEETSLQQVLQAKRSLELPSPDTAFTVVLRTFEEQLHKTRGTDTHALVARAIEAINAARDAIAQQEDMPAPPPGAPGPGSEEELQEELDKEKLDPGG